MWALSLTCGGWSRLIARFARCSTTGWIGEAEGGGEVGGGVLGHRHLDAEPVGELAGVGEVLLADRADVLEDRGPAVVRHQGCGGGAVHDRAGPAGDRVG